VESHEQLPDLLWLRISQLLSRGQDISTVQSPFFESRIRDFYRA